MDINTNGNLLISGSIDGNAIVYNLNTAKIIKKHHLFKKQLVIQPCMDAKFNPFNDKLIAFSCWNGQISVYDESIIN